MTMAETTRLQIAGLRLGGRPLVICDVDEVVVHFTRELEDHLDTHGLYLSPQSFALNGNVRRKFDDEPVAYDELITNSGPKGPAIRRLAGMAGGKVVFIDDSPQFLASAFEYAPDVHLVHFLHDERFARHVPEADYVSLRTGRWDEALPHVQGLIA